MIEKIARIICSSRCQLAESQNKPCINADGTNGKCQATIDQLVLGGELRTVHKIIDAIMED